MRGIRSRLTYANVVSTLALFLVLTGGLAYAADTIFSSDIVDGEVKSEDIATAAVRTQELGTNQIRTADVRDDFLAGGGLTGADIAPNAIATQEVENGSLYGSDIAPNELTGDQIAEETLNVQERVVQIDYDQPDTDNTLLEIANQSGLHILARCDKFPFAGSNRLELLASSDFNATSRSTYHYRQVNTAANGDPVEDFVETADRAEFLSLTPATPRMLIDWNASGTGFSVGGTSAIQVGAQTIYRDDQTVISLDLSMIVNARTDRCQVYGTMLSATVPP